MTVLRGICDIVFATWVMVYTAARFIHAFRPDAITVWMKLGAAHQELLPFAGPALCFRIGEQLAHPDISTALGTVGGFLWVILMWLSRNWPDDRWDRRKRKAKTAVKRLGARLVVVPRAA